MSEIANPIEEIEVLQERVGHLRVSDQLPETAKIHLDAAYSHLGRALEEAQ